MVFSHYLYAYTYTILKFIISGDIDMGEFYIIVLNSSSVGIHLYKILKDLSLDVDIISTPCTISAGCSRAIKVKEKDIEAAKNVINSSKIIIKGIYKKVYKGSSFYYLKIQYGSVAK